VAGRGVRNVHMRRRGRVADGMRRVSHAERECVVGATVHQSVTAPRSPGASIVAEAIACDQL
jgi:hypothetical protein